ncbi:hypothetical protein Sjap_022062 [Stephania japonica]|uniref:DEAD/DEAH-box helicase domain-containing protein n=1 Tax=Stephania japonica TaxID=461633 RepID=A0AAP0EN65_9MAGN
MASVLGAMTYYVVKSKRTRLIRKRQKFSRRSGSNSWYPSDFSDSEVNPIYAICCDERLGVDVKGIIRFWRRGYGIEVQIAELICGIEAIGEGSLVNVPSPIQSHAWPFLLDSRDLIDTAKTGSVRQNFGIGIPALMHVLCKKKLGDSGRACPWCSVLSPTTELAPQIADVLCKAGKSCGVKSICLFGGSSKGTHIQGLKSMSKLVESKEVSRDVGARNYSYSLWLKDLKELKSRFEQTPLQFPEFLGDQMMLSYSVSSDLDEFEGFVGNDENDWEDLGWEVFLLIELQCWVSLKTKELYAMMLLARYLDLCGGHRANSHGIGLKVQQKQDDLLQSGCLEGVPQDTVFIHPSVIDMLDSAAEDAIKCGHFIGDLLRVDILQQEDEAYCNHEEEATSISDEEMVDGDANIDDEEMVDANIDDEEMVDANIDGRRRNGGC